jgi:hypothetical protein
MKSILTKLLVRQPSAISMVVRARPTRAAGPRAPDRNTVLEFFPYNHRLLRDLSGHEHVCV